MRTNNDRTSSLSTLRLYLALMLYMVFSKIVLGFLRVDYTDPSQAAIFTWSSIVLLTVAGMIGLALAARSGFPVAWDKNISNFKRIGIPALLGMAFGILSLIINGLLHLPKVDIGFPASLFVYSAGAIVVEVFYRLLPLPFLLWIISTVLLRGRGQEITFWILAILLSALEPWAQYHALANLGVTGIPLALTALEIYVANLTQAYFFRKYGLFASLTIRLSHYIIWHVVGMMLY